TRAAHQAASMTGPGRHARTRASTGAGLTGRDGRGPGRSRDGRLRRPGPRAWTCLLVVVAFAAAMAGAGTATKTPRPDQPTSRLSVSSRDYSCSGGIPGAHARIGVLRAYRSQHALVDG